jgi:hypothetical protein
MVVEDACFDLFHRAGMSDRARIGGSRIPEIGGALLAIEDHVLLPDFGELHGKFWRDEALEGRTPISHSPAGWWRKHEC